MASGRDMRLSSPDPLAMSDEDINIASPTKALRISSTPRKALANTSGNTQVQEFYFKTPPPPKRHSSPVKSLQHTDHAISPWRLRLTVQAEQIDTRDDISRRKSSPTKITEQTTTVTVPLKGGHESSPTAMKRGRRGAKKSVDSPVKRRSTPRPKASGRRKSVPAALGNEERDDNASVATTSPQPRKSRPKKSMELVQPEENTALLKSDIDGAAKDVPLEKPVRQKSKGRRQEITPMKTAPSSDSSNLSSNGDRAQVRTEAGAVSGICNEFTLSSTHSKSDLDHQEGRQDIENSDDGHEMLSIEQSKMVLEDEALWRSMIHGNTHSPIPNDAEVKHQLCSDPTDEHQEFDSVLESEGFSMVSVSSLPSTGNCSTSPAEADPGILPYGPPSRLKVSLAPSESAEPSLVTFKSPAANGFKPLDNVIEDVKLPNCARESYARLSSVKRKVTPAIASPPLAPPAVKVTQTRVSPRPLEAGVDGTPQLARVIRAGSALQGVLSPQQRSQRLGSLLQESGKRSSAVDGAILEARHKEVFQPTIPKAPKEHKSDHFGGFGAGTRRELKAGLRLGEELAKRQIRTLQATANTADRIEHDVFQVDAEIWRSGCQKTHTLKPPLVAQQEVSYPKLPIYQLPSPERSEVDAEEDRMSWKADTPIKPETILPRQLSARNQVPEPDASLVDYTMLEREAQWQREREAVSRQIELANSSQVIIIDSDDEEDQSTESNGHDEIDIWVAEESLSEASEEATREVPKASLEPEIIKPLRSKLPSPWRRNSQIVYSDETEPTESDLFWQPDQAQANAARKRKEKKNKAYGISASLAEVVSETSERSVYSPIQTEPIDNEPWGSMLGAEGQSISGVNSLESAEIAAGRHEMYRDIQGPMESGPVDGSEQDLEGSTHSTVREDSTSSLSAGPPSPSNLPIDPLLLQMPIQPPNPPQQTKLLQHPRPLTLPAQPPKTWLSLVTRPLSLFFTPVTQPPAGPPATESDILCSSPFHPLTVTTPWTPAHSSALAPLYYASLLYGAYIFPFHPYSLCARFRGSIVSTPLGWKRKATMADCGVVDAFMVLLHARGTLPGRAGEAPIQEGLVLGALVQIWQGMVMRGEIEVQESEGEVVGLRREGDRIWTKGDIDWEHNQIEYFERKRREFDGLPSWKEKGLRL